MRFDKREHRYTSRLYHPLCVQHLGPIPPQLGQLVHLAKLQLKNNELTGKPTVYTFAFPSFP